MTTEVPITRSVLRWAVRESGLALEEIAENLDVEVEEVEAWVEGNSNPGLSKARRLATILGRSISTLLLPKPPEPDRVQVKLRKNPRSPSREAVRKERLAIQDIRRFQDEVSWSRRELGEDEASVPAATVHANPEDVA